MEASVLAQEQFRVMLVDDDESVREVVAEILKRRGWNVDDFSCAEKAIESLANTDYDVILSDINMPGLSGMDFLNKAREAAPGVPVVMITGYPSIDLAVEAMKMGAVDFLPKPFKAEELEIAVRKAAGEARVMKAEVRRSSPQTRAIGNMPQVARRRLEDKIKELSILHTISETLDEVVKKEDIFRKTMDIAQIITDAERAFLAVVEHDNNELVVRASSGYDASPLVGKTFRLDSEPFRSVIANRSYSHMLLDGGDAEFSPLVPGHGAEEGRCQLILAPLVINREVVALLGLSGGMSGGEVPADALGLLLNLTAKSSLKLENIALSENIFTSIIGALSSLINALDARDTYTKDHSNRVTQYALKIARALNSTQETLDSISFAGPLHDIGKIGVRDDILLKQGSFSVDEREIMKSHVVRGEEILRPLNLLASEKSVVLFHHERWDGGGYPNSLSGKDIPMVARIFSVADTFDAMTSTRPYRKALSHEIAKNEIVRCAGSQFDPEVVEAFLGSGILMPEGAEVDNG